MLNYSTPSKNTAQFVHLANLNNLKFTGQLQKKQPVTEYTQQAVDNIYTHYDVIAKIAANAEPNTFKANKSQIKLCLYPTKKKLRRVTE